MVRPGDRVSERYEVIEQLAVGGMGTLWRARHLELEVDVALKVISGGSPTPGSLKRFKREAQAAARLRSPNIVQVLDFGVFEGQPFLTMELLRGEDLAGLLAREGKLSLARCLKIIDGVAKGVQLAHDAEIVHRDLKPANIFLEKVAGDEVVKILDFGVAKDLRLQADPGGTTSAGAVGSPAYMSPEQVWAENVGPRADVWALGVVTFEMLTGENPFADDTLAKVFERIIRVPLPKASDFNALLPKSLDAFFEHAFARNAADRIPSAKGFMDQLRQAAEGIETLGASGALRGKAAELRTVSPFATTQGRSAAGAGGATRRPKALWLAAALLPSALAFLLIPGRSAKPAADNVTKLSHGALASAGAAPGPGAGVVPVASAHTPASAPSVATPPASAPTRRPEPRRAPGRAAEAPRTLSIPASAAQPALDPKFGIPLPQ